MILHALILLAILLMGLFLSLRRVDGLLKVDPFKAGIFSAVAILYAFVLLPSFGMVQAGSRGVVLQWGAVTGRVLDAGLYFVTPLVQTVEPMDVQTRAYAAHAAAASHDLQQVSTDITVNYQLDPGKVSDVYQNLRHDYESRILAPSVQNVVKAATAKYPAEGLITNRAAVVLDIEALLKESVAPHGMLINGINLTNFTFSKDFEAAIEAKAVAQQNVQVEQNKLRQIEVSAQQQVTQAKAAADATIAKANGDAEATKLNGDAAAYAIRARAAALRENPNLVELNAVDKWDGKLPTTQVPGSALPFIQLPTLR